MDNPIERSKRLERVRNMANLTRKELCNELGLSMEVYKNWELGRFGGLTHQGAQKIVNYIAQKNVICTLSWLLQGEGISPYALPTFYTTVSPPNQLHSCNSIMQELTYLGQFYQNIIFTEVTDDSLAPEYMVSDIVAGVKVDGEKINTLINYACIIQDNEGRLTTRYLKAGSTKNTYNLVSTNINSTVSKPFEYDVSINFAAKIFRRYQK